MEGLLVLIGIGVLWVVLKNIRANEGTNYSYSSSHSRPIPRPPSFEACLVNGRLGEDNDGPKCKEVEVRGPFPLKTYKKVAFVTSVFDMADGNPKAILCPIEHFQEPESIAYQHVVGLGNVSGREGFSDWTKVGCVIPEILLPPRGGRRRVSVVVRLIDVDNPPIIINGFHDTNHPGIFWSKELIFNLDFDAKGYEEEAEHREEARSISIKVAMAVALSDGSLDDSEGQVIKTWVEKSIEPYADSKKERLKKLYNQAIKDGYQEAKNGVLSLSDLTSSLNEIAEKSTKYETVELCFDVMAADGVADKEEIKVIRKIADALELDLDEIEKMRDEKIVSLDSSSVGHAGIDDLLGIAPDWSEEQIKKHLRQEFQKWNNRLNTLDEGEERENAQKMLDMISEARKKYA